MNQNYYNLHVQIDNVQQINKCWTNEGRINEKQIWNFETDTVKWWGFTECSNVIEYMKEINIM